VKLRLGAKRGMVSAGNAPAMRAAVIGVIASLRGRPDTPSLGNHDIDHLRAGTQVERRALGRLVVIRRSCCFLDHIAAQRRLSLVEKPGDSPVHAGGKFAIDWAGRVRARPEHAEH